MQDPDSLTAELATVLAEKTGGTVEIGELRRLTAGATKGTWAFDAMTGGKTEPLILQISRPRILTESHDGTTDPQADLPLLSGSEDAAIQQAADQAGIAVPHVRFILALDRGRSLGVITDFVPGESLGRAIVTTPALSAARQVFARQCGQNLAKLHAIDPATLPFLKALGPADQVQIYRRIYESFDHPQPALELGLCWSEDHLPERSVTCVVHGDFRNGNMIVNDAGIGAILDWEIAHLGDPMEDLGWLCVNTWRFGGSAPVGGVGRREELFGAYEQAGGRLVDPDHVRFWEGFGCIKWAIICMMKGQAYRRGGGLARGLDLEAAAIGRRTEEPLHDFLNLAYPGD